MHKTLKWFKYYRLPILSGILIGTSYIPFPPWALFFCLVPLWIFWQNEPSAIKAFVGGWVCQFVLSLIGFHWIAHTAHEFGQLPWIFAVPALLGFCSFGSLHFAIAGGIAALVRQRTRGGLISSILLWISLLTLGERFYPMIFAWNFGYPWLWIHFPGYHWADVIGFEGLSSISFILNGFLFWAWQNRQRRLHSRFVTFTAIFLLLVIGITGQYHGRSWFTASEHLKIAAVQANIGNYEKLYDRFGQFYQGEILNRHVRLTLQALQKYPDTDLVVWPETAFADYLDPGMRKGAYADNLMLFVRQNKKALLTGAYSRDFGGVEYNSVFLVDADGTIKQAPYRKSDLLAFGEHFPGGDYFPFLYKIVPTISNFGHGTGPMILRWGDLRLGPQICYEGLDADFSRKLAVLGSDIFFNVTNDSWFGRAFEPYQHLYMTMARAVEERRPLVRVTNTGISGVALASGQISGFSPIHQEWTGQLNVAYRHHAPLTWYAEHGEWIARFWLFVLCLTLVLRWAWKV